MSQSRPSVLVAVFLAAIIFCMSFQHIPVAYAATRNIETIVRGQPTTIPQNEVVEDVLVLGHNVTVKGHITELLVVMDGNIRLASSSRTGIVVDIGGSIKQEPGAHVEGVYHLSLNSPFWNGTLFGLVVALALWAAGLALNVALVLVSVLVSLGIGRLRIPLANEDRSVRRIGLLGTLISVAVLSVCSLLALTMLALPVAAILVVLYVATGVMGLSVTSLWIGRIVFRNTPSQRPVWLLSLIGSSLTAAFMNIPLIGVLLFCILWLIGIGAVARWLSEAWAIRRRNRSS